MTSLRDYRGMEVLVGDIVLDDRGKAWRITSDELKRERLGHGMELRWRVRARAPRELVEAPGEYVVRVYHCFKITEESVTGNPKLGERYWWRLYNTLVRSELDTEMRQRHVDADEALRKTGIRKY